MVIWIIKFWVFVSLRFYISETFTKLFHFVHFGLEVAVLLVLLDYSRAARQNLLTRANYFLLLCLDAHLVVHL